MKRLFKEYHNVHLNLVHYTKKDLQHISSSNKKNPNRCSNFYIQIKSQIFSTGQIYPYIIKNLK